MTQKAQREHDKAVKQQYKTARALSEAQRKHDLSAIGESKAAHDLSVGIVMCGRTSLPATVLTSFR